MKQRNHKSITIESYDDNAKGYADWYYSNQIMESELDEFVELLGNYKYSCKTILDLGCGPGQDSYYLANKGFHLTGVDLSTKLLSIAKLKVPNAKFVKLDIENELPLLKTKFCGIWSCASMLHVKRELIGQVISNLHELLENNGILFLSMMKGEGEIIKNEERPFGKMTRYFAYYSIEELEKTLLNQDFKILHKQKKGRWITIYAMKQ